MFRKPQYDCDTPEKIKRVESLIKLMKKTDEQEKLLQKKIHALWGKRSDISEEIRELYRSSCPIKVGEFIEWESGRSKRYGKVRQIIVGDSGYYFIVDVFRTSEVKGRKNGQSIGVAKVAPRHNPIAWVNPVGK